MKFKSQIKRGKGVLNRGDRCLYRSADAVYLGSFKNDNDVHWNHMLLIRSVMAGELTAIEEFIMTTMDSKEIMFKAMMTEPVEGQMILC